jgi:signal transduction histidine kinase/ligand-binding sensor domain-containing protein/DNA-binding NarL/FixJ family response regulator
MVLKCKRISILVILISLIYVHELWATEYPPVISLGIEKGLSNNSVRCIFKDKKGFMWFGTHDGLNRFDGYEFKIFRNILGNDTSIPHNFIYSINEDQQGNLWVGTGQGIAIFNNLTSKFTPAYYLRRQDQKKEKISVAVNVVATAPNGDVLMGTNGSGLLVQSKNSATALQLSIRYNNKTITDCNVTAIKVDKQQRVWVVIDAIGLCLYNLKTKQIQAVNTSIQIISCMEVDDHNNLWLGGAKGLYKYNISSNTLALGKNGSPESFANEHVLSLCFDKHQNLWMGLKGIGIKILKPETGKYSNRASGGVAVYFANESVPAIFQDTEGRKWIGTSKGGISIVDARSASFKTVTHDPKNPFGLINNFASTFLEEQPGKIWIGTDGGGISLWERKTNKFTNFSANTHSKTGLSSNMVSSIKKDYLGNIWIATFGGGVNKFNPNNQSFERFKCFNDYTGVENQNVWQLLEDQDHTLWATTFSAGILYQFNRGTNRFQVFDPKFKEDLMSIWEDRTKMMWGGNARALIQINRAKRKYDYFDIGKPVRVIYEDRKGNFWLGTEGGGLILFDRKNGKIAERYSTAQGLCNNSILSIVEDLKGNLWLGTFSGLAKFNPSNKTFLKFYQDDGLQSNQFSDNATLRLQSGELIIGGLKGFSIFHPDSIQSTKTVPSILLTGLRINNLPISSVTPYITKTNGDQIESLEIPYNDAVVSFDFAALAYDAPGKISYAYYMQGWDKGWNYSKLRTAVYTKLSEGNYLLRIKSTNTEGRWMNNERTIKIHILPPWYRSWFAYLVYAAMGICVVYLYITYQRRQSYLKYQVDLANLKVKQEKELSENKLSFFTHISHEFRTPLTLIINPIKEFINSKNSTVDSKDLIIVYRNARRLLSLVDQLLLFRKSEMQDLKIAKFDLVSFCKEIYVCFGQQAKSRNIAFNFECKEKSILMYADREKIEIVIFNLIANAFKFTPEGGKITLKITQKADEISLHVVDNGAGISEGTGAKIFNRFYQDSNQSSATGFGIGLFLVKKFIDGHQGSVSYTSTVGLGTDFKITLLKGKDHFKDELIHEEEIKPTFVPELIEEDGYTIINEFDQIDEDDDPKTAIALDPSTEKKAMLIVEDHNGIRNYIKQIFKSDYLIYEAENGKQGYELAKKYSPDIVITDIVMKELNGIDLCMKIKSDPELSHIPVILLTSNSSSEIKLKGIEQGADDFITKPFEKEILIARVANLLKSRSTLQRYFFNEITLKSEDFKVSSEYKEFLEKCIEITEKHLDDPDFSVKTLADELATSPSLLYRKVKSISGKSTNEFIRYIRLRKAAQLMVNSSYNINQTALLCGFNDVRYFREQFSKLFGIRPSDYIKKYRTNLSEKHRLIQEF